MADRFDYAQAEEIHEVFARHGVRYLFLGKSGAILLGFPDTTQDAVVFVEKTPENGRAIGCPSVPISDSIRDQQVRIASRRRIACRPFARLRAMLVLWTYLYLALRRVLEFIGLIFRSERSKEVEILVLRHELAVLRRQAGPPRYKPADRALLAALSRLLPRVAWASFLVAPKALLGWHRRMVGAGPIRIEPPVDLGSIRSSRR